MRLKEKRAIIEELCYMFLEIILTPSVFINQASLITLVIRSGKWN
jgi:hypothetical protein